MSRQRLYGAGWLPVGERVPIASRANTTPDRQPGYPDIIKMRATGDYPELLTYVSSAGIPKLTLWGHGPVYWLVDVSHTKVQTWDMSPGQVMHFAELRFERETLDLEPRRSS